MCKTLVNFKFSRFHRENKLTLPVFKMTPKYKYYIRTVQVLSSNLKLLPV